MPTSQDCQVFTLGELMGYRKVARSNGYRLAQEGRPLGQKVGRNWRFRKAVTHRWLDRQYRGED